MLRKNIDVQAAQEIVTHILTKLTNSDDTNAYLTLIVNAYGLKNFLEICSPLARGKYEIPMLEHMIAAEVKSALKAFVLRACMQAMQNTHMARPAPQPARPETNKYDSVISTAAKALASAYMTQNHASTFRAHANSSPSNDTIALFVPQSSNIKK